MKNLITVLLCIMTFTFFAEANNSIRFRHYPSKLSSTNANHFTFKYSADHESILYVQVFDENWKQVYHYRDNRRLLPGTNRDAHASGVFLESSNSSIHYVQVKLYNLSNQQIAWDQRVYYGALYKNSSLSNTANSDIQLNTYPNPVEDYIYLEYNLNKEGEVDIEIYNPIGKLVKVIQSNEYLKAGVHTNRVNASFLDAGMYLIKVVTEEENKISKVLKQ